MSGLTSQPSMGAVCMALEQTTLGTGIRYADIQALNNYWSQVRILYSCFEANVRASDSSVFDHEMPGGQYTNLMVSSNKGSVLLSYWSLFIVPSCATWARRTMDRYMADRKMFNCLTDYHRNQEEIYRSEWTCKVILFWLFRSSF